MTSSGTPTELDILCYVTLFVSAETLYLLRLGIT